MSNAIATVTQQDWDLMLDQARVLVPTGFLPNSIKSPEQAVAIMLKGRELGVPAMYALSNIVVIQGKPTANAELMLALVYRDHGDGAVIVEESTHKLCRLSYKRRAWDGRREFAFTIDDAKTAQLLSNATWQKYPAAMLRARAISAVARMAFPDSIGGMYTPEELGARVTVTASGDVVLDEEPADSGTNGVPHGTAAVTDIAEAVYHAVIESEPEPKPELPRSQDTITKERGKKLVIAAQAKNYPLAKRLEGQGYQRLGQIQNALADIIEREIAEYVDTESDELAEIDAALP